MTMRSDFPNETRLHCSFKLDLDNYYYWRSDKCTQGRHSLSRAGMICASFVESNTWPIYESLRRHTLAERFLFPGGFGCFRWCNRHLFGICAAWIINSNCRRLACGFFYQIKFCMLLWQIFRVEDFGSLRICRRKCTTRRIGRFTDMCGIFNVLGESRVGYQRRVVERARDVVQPQRDRHRRWTSG